MSGVPDPLLGIHSPALPAEEKAAAQRAVRGFFTLTFSDDERTRCKQAAENTLSADAFKTWLDSITTQELCGEPSCETAVIRILQHEFAFDAPQWESMVYGSDDRFGLGLTLDRAETRDPFAMVFQTKMGRGIWEPQKLTEAELMQEIRALVVDWHDLFADAFPWIGKLFVKMTRTNTGEELEKVDRWIGEQSATTIEYSESKNDYVDGGESSRTSLRTQVRKLLLTMYVYEKMSLRSILDKNYLAALHRYYEGSLAEAQKGLDDKETKERKEMLLKGTFGSMFMQLKQASVSITFPGLSAMKNGEQLKPEVSAGLLGILSVNIFEAVMGELLIKGRLGNGVCGVGLIGSESQKDIKYVTRSNEVPHLVNTSFHEAILFGQGECPKDLVDTPVYPMHIPLDREYLNAYTSWNALFTTTMSDNHIVFAKLLYPRMLRAMIHNPGQWGDQRPWSLYMAVSGFWLRTEKRKSFISAVDFFAAEKKLHKVLHHNVEHVVHKVGGNIKEGVDGIKESVSNVKAKVGSTIGGFLGRVSSPRDPRGYPSPSNAGAAGPANASSSADREEDNAPDAPDMFFEVDDLLCAAAGDLRTTSVDEESSEAPEARETAMEKLLSFFDEGDEVARMLAEVDGSQIKPATESGGKVKDAVRRGVGFAAAIAIDELTEDRYVAGFYKPMLPEYPKLIQFWTEMNHRYGDLMKIAGRSATMPAGRYNFSDDFDEKYNYVSRKARKCECISHDGKYKPDKWRAAKPAVPVDSSMFVLLEIMKTGGRTHDYLEEFYGKRNEEMAKLLKSSIYPGSEQMDMSALIEKTGMWKKKFELP